MKRGEVSGVGKPVSRLVMGAMLETAHFPLPHASVMFDAFFEAGGNCFDTAYIYGGGSSERVLGRWIRNRGVRDQVVILDKGAHTPNCNPTSVLKQLSESLDRLQTDHVDLYMLHRDNPDIPVGEFIDVLNKVRGEGKVRAFGASNWTIERIQAANDYARANDVSGFAAISNQFSLARMVEPVWGGCLSASDPQSREWFIETQTPLMAWSSTARGFFVRGDANARSDADFARCWYAEDNFRRLERARELAAKREAQPVVIAMAYALNQPFPVFPLFGPQTLVEMRTSLRALDVDLSPAELAWLNLET